MPRVIASFALVLAIALACGLSPVAMAQQAEPQASAENRITVRRMVPPPDVGPGAPYHSPEEITQIASAAERVAVEANASSRMAGRSDACRDSVSDMNTPGGINLLDRIPRNVPRLQGLYRDARAQATRVSQLAGKALDATERAEDVRRDAANGAPDKARMEKTELDRQKAVNELEKARAKLLETQARIADYGDISMRNGQQEIQWMDLDMKALSRRKAGWGLNVPKPATLGGLVIADMASGEFEDERGFFVVVAGEVVNNGSRPEKPPGFVISMLDTKGFLLRNEMAAPAKRAALKPGERMPFNIVVRPSPQYVGNITLNFATGKEPPPELPVGLLCEANPPPGAEE